MGQTRWLWAGASMVVVLLMVRALSARIINVGTDPARPFTTIQAAIDAASDGDIVVVADGTYTGIGNGEIDFCGKAITVRSATGPQCCLIDCRGGTRGFVFHSGEKESAVLDGFTIRGARDNGGAIFNRYDTSPELRHCVFSDNSARSAGGGIYNRDSASPCLFNCLFFGNRAGDSGGAVYSRNDSSPTLTNCTIADNTAGFEGGGVMNWDDCHPELKNCILWGNVTDEGVPEQAQIQGGAPRFSFCCIESCGRDLAGTGSITNDPLFVPGISGDYYLSRQAAGQASTSPCCDAGISPPAATDLAGFTTRTDQTEDSVPLDMGYHYPVIVPADPGAGNGGE